MPRVWTAPRTHRLLALAAVVGATTVNCDLGKGENFGHVKPPPSDHFRWCNAGEPESIDPGLVTSVNGVKLAYALFDGLTTHDPMGLPEPSMATHWEVSEHFDTYTFHLRDDLRWSDGVRITAHDFIYHAWRVLHPLTASGNAEDLWKVKRGKLVTTNRGRVLLRDAAPFRAGNLVTILPGKDSSGAELPVPDTNTRTTRSSVVFRAEPRNDAAIWGNAPADAELTIIELSTDRTWAYVSYSLGEGLFGWVDIAALVSPNAEREYTVAAIDEPSRTGIVRGTDLLMLPELLGMKAIDDRTLRVETEGPTPFFLSLTLLRGFRPTPRHAVSPHPRTWTKLAHLVTSGPFHLKEWRPRDKFELVRSETFWGRDAVRLARVTIFSIDSQAASANLYYQGGCDAIVANNLPASYLPVLAGKDGRKPKSDFTLAPYNGIYFLLINNKRFANVHLRRALSHALDRTQLPNLLKGGEIPTAQYTPGNPIAGLSDEDLTLCGVRRTDPGVALIVEKGKLCYVPPPGADFDLAAAKRELELARTEMGAAFPKKMVLKFNTGVERHKHIAEWAQYQWERVLGIDIELEAQEWRVYLNDTSPAIMSYDLGRLGWIGNLPDPEAEFLPNYRCGGPNNRAGFCAADFERYLDTAAQTFDRAERLELVHKAEKVMMDAQPIVPLFVYTQAHLVKPYVRGLSINLFDQPSLRNVWIDPNWKAATK